MCGQDFQPAATSLNCRASPRATELGARVLLLEEAAPLVEAVHHASGARLYDEAKPLSGTAGGSRPGLSYQLNAYNPVLSLIIKQTKRVGCGHRSMINYQVRILNHIAVTRP